MSRSTNPPFPPMHLVVQRTSNELSAVPRSIPFGNRYCETDFGGLFVLYHLYRYALENPKREDEKTGVFRNIKMCYDVWLLSLSFLLDARTFSIIPSLIAPAVFPPEIFPSTEEQLAQLGAALHMATSRIHNVVPQCFFNRNHQRYESFQAGSLINAAFNADLSVIKDILKNSGCPEILLSISGEVIADGYPDIKRRGTALELALMSGDTEIAEEIKKYLNPEKFKQQFENVFGSDFAAFEKKQTQDAEVLFKDLVTACNDATKSQEFQNKLADYVKTHPVHNPFILEKAYEIYNCNHYDMRSDDRRYLFAKWVIRFIQERSPNVWKQHYIEGIAHCARRIKRKEAAARRSFVSTTIGDVRAANWGVLNCIDIFGGMDGLAVLQSTLILSSTSLYGECVKQKQDVFKNYAAVVGSAVLC